VLLHLEVFVITSFSFKAAAERNTIESAILAKTPLVINADVVLRVAAQFAAYKGAAMAAAIDEAVDFAIFVTMQNDRRFANIAPSKIIWIVDLRLKPN
jgi:hypothetical protein